MFNLCKPRRPPHKGGVDCNNKLTAVSQARHTTKTVQSNGLCLLFTVELYNSSGFASRRYSLEVKKVFFHSRLRCLEGYYKVSTGFQRYYFTGPNRIYPLLGFNLLKFNDVTTRQSKQLSLFMKVLFEVPKLLTLSNRLSFSMCNNIGYLAQKVTLLSLYLFFANRGLTAKHNLRESPCVMTSQSKQLYEVLFEVISFRTIVSRLSFGMFKNIGYLSAQLTTRQGGSK